MKLHLVTIGKPKLSYAQQGWDEYIGRLRHFHQLRVTHLADKQNDAKHLLEAIGTAYLVALTVDGTSLDSPALAQFLEQRALDGREICFVIGGPDGLPTEVITASQYQLSLSGLTFPHDLAMVVLAEALYRASSISAGLPYHR